MPRPDPILQARLPMPVWVLLVGMLYFGAAHIGLQLAYEGTNISPFWPPAGLAFAALLLLGWRIWPGILLGALLANFTSFLIHQPAQQLEVLLGASLLVGAGNTWEAVLGAWLLQRMVREDWAFARVGDSFRFVLVVLAMCLGGALIGPLSLAAVGIVPWAQFSTLAYTWWLGDVTGALLVAPPLLFWFRFRSRWDGRDWLERGVAAAVLLLLSQLTFGNWFHLASYLSQPYLLLPALLVIAFRLGAREAVLGLLLMSSVAIWGTIHGSGPFVRESLNESLLLLQIYLGVVAITLLVLTAALSERIPRHVAPTPERGGERQPIWFPLLLTLSLSLVSIVLGLALHSQEQHQLRQKILTQLRTSQHLIRLHLDTRVQALQRLAIRWELYDGAGRHSEWERDAWAYYHDFRSFLAISWLDAKYYVRWTIPVRGNERVPGFYVGGDARRRKAIDAAYANRSFAVTETINIIQGGRGFIVYAPVFGDGRFHGWTAGIFRYQDVIEQGLDEGLGKDYAIEISDGHEVVYRHRPEGTLATEWAEESVLRLHDITWRIRFTPVTEMVREQISPLPQLTALVGILLAGLLGWTSYLSRRMRHNNLSIRAKNAQLSAEIGERQRTEAALRESKDKWQALIEQIKDAVLIADFESAYFIEANAQACELFGYQPEAFKRLKGRHLTAPEGHSLSAAFSADLNQRGYAQNPAMPLLTHSGERFWGDLRATVFRVGERKLVVNVIRDVTDRVNTELELLKAKKFAEEASHAKGEFLANMSHEIRTPLNAIIGLNHLLLRTGLNSRQLDYVRNNQQAARNLLGLINDILDVSKIEAGMLELEAASFELDGVLKQLFNLLARQAQEKGLELLVSLSPEVPLAYVGDRLRLEQVLVNLLSNAIKFTAQGEIELAITLIETSADEVRLGFSVRDTGVGISPEQSGHLFNAFSQGDSSITRKYGGSGLGLTISRHLVDLMRGQLSFESEPDQGSTFRFDAWFRQAHTPQPAPVDLPVSPRCLILDDHPRALEILAGYLQDLGLPAETCRLGQAELPDLAAYDLLLLDWPLQDPASLDALLKPRAATPRLLLMVGDSAELPDLAAYGLSLDGLLQKPIVPARLHESLLGLFAPELLVAAEPVQSHESRAAERLRPFTGARLLLVEDNRINQRVAQELLEAQGFRVDIVNHGAEALDALDRPEHPYALVLMDLQMPVMDGFEATRRIRAQARFRELPIVAMTADVIAGTREKALRAGMNDYISKPIELTTLYEVLRRWLSQMPTLPAAPAEAQALPELPGLEANDTLRRLGGNLAFYRELLQDFEQELPRQLSELESALTRVDHDIAAYLAHSLKGMASNLGAVDLAEALNHLDTALKSDLDPAPAWQATRESAAILLAHLPRLTALEKA